MLYLCLYLCICIYVYTIYDCDTDAVLIGGVLAGICSDACKQGLVDVRRTESSRRVLLPPVRLVP